MDEEEAVRKIEKSAVDALLTIVLPDKKKEKRYVASQLYYSPNSYSFNYFWWYRSALYNRIYAPGTLCDRYQILLGKQLL